eukprot:PhF_6_TR8308/c0_g1_i2/m.12848
MDTLQNGSGEPHQIQGSQPIAKTNNTTPNSLEDPTDADDAILSLAAFANPSNTTSVPPPPPPAVPTETQDVSPQECPPSQPPIIKSWEENLVDYAAQRKLIVAERCSKAPHLTGADIRFPQYMGMMRSAFEKMISYIDKLQSPNVAVTEEPTESPQSPTNGSGEERAASPTHHEEISQPDWVNLIEKWVDLGGAIGRNSALEGLPPYSRGSLLMGLEKAKRVIQLMLETESKSDKKRKYVDKLRASDRHNDPQHKLQVLAFQKEFGIEESKWIFSFHHHKLKPEYAATLVLALFLYTVDLKADCGCTTLDMCESKQGNDLHKITDLAMPGDKAAFGWKSQPWAVVNWCVRVGMFSPEPEAVRKKCLEGLNVFEFLMEKWEEGLYFLPKHRSVVFRGVNIPVAAKYKLGYNVVFPAFTSTSLVGVEAQNFMNKNGSGTFFIIHVHGASMIQAFSWFPEEAEALMSTFSTYYVKMKMSRTVLQALGCKYDVVEMSEVGDQEATSAELIDSIYSFQRHIRFVYEGHLKSYVVSRVDVAPPPRPPNSGLPIFGDGESEIGVAEKWLDSATTQHLLILGTAGTGKTSTSLAALSRLVTRPRAFAYKGVIAVFCPLPKIANVLEPKAIDKHVIRQIGLRNEADYEYILTQYNLVVLLDSLDEIVVTDPKQVHNILEKNPFCARARCMVSCRPEFFTGLNIKNPSSALVSSTEKCAVYYVLPFEKDDVEDCLSRFVTNESNIPPAMKSGYRQAITQLLELLSFDYVTMHTPVTLRMALRVAYLILLQYNEQQQEIALSAKQTRKAVRDRALGSSAKVLVPSRGIMKRWELYQQYIQDYARLLSPDEQAQLKKGLWAIAIKMVNAGKWHITVGVAVEGMMSAGVSDSLARRWLENCTPCRMEDAQDDTSMFEWQHKSFGEFLAAEALWSNPVETLDSLRVVFSRAVPMLGILFGDIASGLFFTEFTMKVEQVLLPYLAANMNTGDKVSNVLTLLVAGKWYLHGITIKDTSVENVDFTDSRLDGTKFLNVRFQKCIFNNTSLRGVDLTDSYIGPDNVVKIDRVMCKNKVVYARVFDTSSVIISDFENNLAVHNTERSNSNVVKLPFTHESPIRYCGYVRHTHARKELHDAYYRRQGQTVDVKLDIFVTATKEENIVRVFAVPVVKETGTLPMSKPSCWAEYNSVKDEFYPKQVTTTVKKVQAALYDSEGRYPQYVSKTYPKDLEDYFTALMSDPDDSQQVETISGPFSFMKSNTRFKYRIAYPGASYYSKSVELGRVKDDLRVYHKSYPGKVMGSDEKLFASILNHTKADDKVHVTFTTVRKGATELEWRGSDQSTLPGCVYAVTCFRSDRNRSQVDKLLNPEDWAFINRTYDTKARDIVSKM